MSEHIDGARILRWVQCWLEDNCDVEQSHDDLDADFTSHGLDSAGAVRMCFELGEWLDVEVPPEMLFSHSTPRALAAYLAPGEAAPANEPRVPVTELGRREGVAIIGASCRLPGAHDPEEFWDLLMSSSSAVVPMGGDGAPTWWAGAVASRGDFDSEFFGLSESDAVRMDPQQRVLMQLTWEALENAGISPRGTRGGDTGVFVGISQNEYSKLLSARGTTADDVAGIALSIAANRLSYYYDYRGPSMVVDTACSSSLVALHLACHSLRSGETGMAIVGGVNLALSDDVSAAFAAGGLLSPDGVCRAFDPKANGYVRGEGAVVLVLKRLSDAVRDRDPVYAVVRGSAVRQDGRSNGLMAPNLDAQAELLRAACEDAAVDPASVSYVEAHGTGTVLGDAVEARALGQVFGAGASRESACRIGSVKTNVGHLEAAAGLVGVLKAALSLHRGRVPATLNGSDDPTKQKEQKLFGLEVVREPWTLRAGAPWRFGVSSFGFGGTIAHAILESAPTATERTANVDGSPQVLMLSSRSRAGLEQLVASCKRALERADQEGKGAAALCRVAALRDAHSHRVAVVGRSAGELANALKVPGAESVRGTAGPPRLAVVFPHVKQACLSGGPTADTQMSTRARALDCLRRWGVRAEGLVGDRAAFEAAMAPLECAPHVVESCFWSDAPGAERSPMSAALERGYNTFLVMGRREELGQEALAVAKHARAVLFDLPNLNEDPEAAALDGVAKLFVHGLTLHPTSPDGVSERAFLPSFPWAQRTCWPSPQQLSERGALASGQGGLLGARTDLAFDPNRTLWTKALDPGGDAWVREHVIRDRPVLPGAAVLGALLELAANQSGAWAVVDLNLERPIEVAVGVELQTVAKRVGDKRLECEIYMSDLDAEPTEGRFRRCATALLERTVAQERRPPELSLEQARLRCPQLQSTEALYASFDRLGMHYGPIFRGIRECWRSENQAFTRVELPVEAGGAGYTFHPALLDACLHGILASCSDSALAEGKVFVPSSFGRSQLLRAPKSRLQALWADVRVTRSEGADDQPLTASLMLWDDSGEPVLEIRDLRLRILPPSAPRDVTKRVPTTQRSGYRTRPNLANPFAAPEGDLEEQLASLWVETLRVFPVGALDNFFEVGGDSLDAAEIASEIGRRYDIELSLADSYDALTVRELAALLEQRFLERLQAIGDQEAETLIG